MQLLAVPLVMVVVLAAVVLPRALRPAVLDSVPPAMSPPAGTNLLAGAPDPVAAPRDFASFLSQRLDAYWTRDFAAMGLPYRSPTLLFYDEGIGIPCFPWAAFGDQAPFYCFVNDTIYLPATYISDLSRSLGVGTGGLALAYALAHEYAHHMQHLSGLGKAVEGGVSGPPQVMHNVSVSYERQADCLAGVWAASTYGTGVFDSAPWARHRTRRPCCGTHEVPILTPNPCPPATAGSGPASRQVGRPIARADDDVAASR